MATGGKSTVAFVMCGFIAGVLLGLVWAIAADMDAEKEEVKDAS